MSLNSKLLIALCALAFSAASGASVATSSDWLNAAELKALFQDRTVESVTRSAGRVSKTYYASDGSVLQWRAGSYRRGVWRVEDRGLQGGRICLRMGEGRDKCRAVAARQGIYNKFVVKRDGRHREVVTYRRFEPGNTLPAARGPKQQSSTGGQ